MADHRFRRTRKAAINDQRGSASRAGSARVFETRARNPACRIWVFSIGRSWRSGEIACWRPARFAWRRFRLPARGQTRVEIRSAREHLDQGGDLGRDRTLAPDENRRSDIEFRWQRMNAQQLHVRERLEDDARNHRDPHARHRTAENRVIRGGLDHAIGHLTAAGEPVFHVLAIGTSGFEGEHGPAIDVVRGFDRGVVRRRDDDQLFVVERDFFERRVGDGFGHQRGVEFALAHGGRQFARRADSQFQGHLRVARQIFVHRHRQAHRRGAFHGAEAQQPPRLGVVHGLARFLREVEQPVRVVEQQPSRGREMQLLAVADEQFNAKVGLKLAHAGGDIGLHAVELFRGARHAAGLHHGAEDVQVAEIHRSHPEMDNHHNYSFYVMLASA